MNNFYFKTTILFLFMISVSRSYAQTLEEKAQITSGYNSVKILQLQQEFNAKTEKQKQIALKAAKINNWPIIIKEEGTYAELIRLAPDGAPIYYTTFNVDAATSTRTNHINIGGSLGLNLDGQNMIAHVWDGGLARSTHQEYDGPGGNNRFSIGDASTALNDHAAHVTGTIISSGILTAAKGMAPQSQAVGYDWNDDLSEATNAANNGMLVSNHSYGFRSDLVPDYFFGGYIDESQDWDNLMYNAPHYLMVVAAGNDGNTNYNGSPLDGNSDYDKLTGHAVSKNNMVVANAEDANIDASGNLISVSIRFSSSQGPTDDYRIKPDITGNGTVLYSTLHDSDDAYNSKTGTSMASPNVTGTLLLLQQHYNDLNSNFMRAATLKGLALHTADDIGPVGPDAVHGWGLLNAKRAAQTITENGNISLIQELTLNQGQSYSINVQANEIENLMASISWTDPAGIATEQLNNTTPSLVNDLDIKVTKNTEEWFPWRLTGVDSNANDSDNLVDPFERIEVTNPTGTYTITVTHKGTLTNTTQDYTLIITGIQTNCSSVNIPSNVQATAIKDFSAGIIWDSSSPGAKYDLRYRESGTIAWTDVTDLLVSNTTLTGLTELTEYEVQIRGKCSGGTPTAYSLSFFFTTDDIILEYCDSASDLQNFEYISRVELASIDNPSTNEKGGYSDFTTTNSTAVVAGENYSITITPFWSNSVFNEGYAVWIDFNQNGTFDTSELVFSQSPTQDSPVLGSISIPTTALEGSTRMRVSMKWDDIPDPCEIFPYGEVEDYSVEILKGFVYDSGVWTPNNPVTGLSSSTETDNIAVLNGIANINGELVGNNLRVATGATLVMDNPVSNLSSDATILNLSGNISNDGNIVFKSNLNGSAQLDEFNGTISGSGKVTVERYIPAKRAFRLLSSPLTTSDFIFENWQENGSTPATPDGLGTHITGGLVTDGFDQSGSNSPSMFTFDNSNANGTSVQTDDWIPLSNTNATKLRTGESYLTFIRGDRSIDHTDSSSIPTLTVLRTTGELFTGSLTYSPSNPTSYLNINTVDDFYNLIANPYQAVVDFNAVTKTGLTDFIYVWDAKINGANGRGGYVTVELPSGSATEGDPPSASSSDADQYLAPGMSFFVQNDSDGATSTSITFEEADKAAGENQNEIFSSYSNFYINSRLYKTSNLQDGDTESDAIAIRFSDDFTTPATSEDATKLFNPGENYAVENNGLRSIDKQQIPTIGHQIDLNILNYQETNYSLTFEMDNKPAGLGVFLEDAYLNTTTELTAGFVYDYTVDTNIPESTATDRFRLVFDNTTLGVDDNVFGEGFKIYPNPARDGHFAILTPGLSGEVEVELTNVLGQQVLKQNLIIEGAEVNVNAGKLSSGVYILKLRQEEQTFTSKLIRE